MLRFEIVFDARFADALAVTPMLKDASNLETTTTKDIILRSKLGRECVFVFIERKIRRFYDYLLVKSKSDGRLLTGSVCGRILRMSKVQILRFGPVPTICLWHICLVSIGRVAPLTS